MLEMFYDKKICVLCESKQELQTLLSFLSEKGFLLPKNPLEQFVDEIFSLYFENGVSQVAILYYKGLLRYATTSFIIGEGNLDLVKFDKFMKNINREYKTKAIYLGAI